MVSGNLDQDDPDAVGIFDLHLDQAPRLGYRIPHDRDSGRGQPDVLGAQHAGQVEHARFGRGDVPGQQVPAPGSGIVRRWSAPGPSRPARATRELDVTQAESAPYHGPG